MKNFPIFNLGVYGGGFMSEMRSTRDYPFGTLAKRTIGWVKIENDSIIPENGIEKAFNKYYHGQYWKGDESKNFWRILYSKKV